MKDFCSIVRRSFALFYKKIHHMKKISPPMDITGEKLFTEIKMNDLQFNIYAEQYMDTVFRLAFSTVKSKADADDITQNVLLKLYESKKEFESDAHVKHWLIRVTVNECKKLWRSPWNRTEDFEEYSASLVFEEKRYNDLYHAIMSLDKKYRMIIVLYYYEGCSISDISALLGLPIGTVGTRLSRAREKLKNWLTEADIHE